MKSKLILFLSIYVMWLGLTWPPEPQHVFTGIIVACIVAYLLGDVFVKRPHIFAHPKRYLWFLYFILVFVLEYIKASLEAIFIIIQPRINIKPGIVKVKTKLKTDVGLTFLANAITLTHGTLSVDIDKKAGFIYIHWIDVKAQDVEKATKIIVKRLENILARIFE